MTLAEIEKDWPYGNLFLFRDLIGRAHKLGELTTAKRCAEIAFDAETNYDAKEKIEEEFAVIGERGTPEGEKEHERAGR